MKHLLFVLSLFLSSQTIATGAPLLRTIATGDDGKHVHRDRHLTELKHVGNNGDTGFPLGLCEGDCDTDDDCSGNLKCFKRTGVEKVPGCTKETKYSGEDFCYDSSNNPSDVNSTNTNSFNSSSSDRFRIKMWWEKGYLWQNETIEQKWCVNCRSECNIGVQLNIHECGASTQFQFVGSNSVQIKVTNTNLCWSLYNITEIRLELCNSTDDLQKFSAGQGDFEGERFEIIPITPYALDTHMDGCLSQQHHPKNGEVIREQGCQGARFDTTSFFNKY